MNAFCLVFKSYKPEAGPWGKAQEKRPITNVLLKRVETTGSQVKSQFLGMAFKAPGPI